MPVPSPLPARLADGVVLRLARTGDGRALAAAYVRNREHLAPWEPTRDPEFYGAAAQERQLAVQLREHRDGRMVPLLLSDDAGAVVGRVNLAGIQRGAFDSASLGYWIDHARAGKGIMTAAVAAVLGHAREELGLHRVEAATLLHNAASQAVLAANGFTRIGVAERYLRVAGRWQDHVLFQRILHG